MFVNETARAAGVSANAVRYYSRIGLLNPDRNPDNGYRTFSKQDVRRICFIRKARWLGFTLKDIRTFLSESDSGNSPCKEVRRIIAVRIVENRKQLDRLRVMQDRMENAVEFWASQSDSKPGNEHICGLIDGLACDEESLDLCAGHKL